MPMPAERAQPLRERAIRAPQKPGSKVSKQKINFVVLRCLLANISHKKITKACFVSTSSTEKVTCFSSLAETAKLF
jgi:hypothetical protein